jgi:hypothetical protein
MFGEQGAHNLSLDPDTAAVNDPDFRKFALHGLIKVFLNHDLDFPGLESMQVDGVLNWDFVHRGRI